MKTIKLKIDDSFDEMLTGLAKRMKITKSEVFREAVIKYYRDHLDREELRQRVKIACEKVREQSLQEAVVWDTTIGDGL